MSAPVEPLHYVTVTQDGTDDLPLTTVRFECRGDETSPCHNYPACDCESWGDGHEHPRVVHDECWMQQWFDSFSADDIAANYTPPSDSPDFGWRLAHNLPAHSGPIDTEFDDGLSWWWPGYPGLHRGRSWGGPGPLEASCPCTKAACGLVADVNPACAEHPDERAKTMRSLHYANWCPALREEKGR